MYEHCNSPVAVDNKSYTSSTIVYYVFVCVHVCLCIDIIRKISMVCVCVVCVSVCHILMRVPMLPYHSKTDGQNVKMSPDPCPG